MLRRNYEYNSGENPGIYECDEAGNPISLAGWNTPVVYGHNIRAMVAQLHTLGTLSNDKIHEFLRAITRDRLPISEGTVYGMLKKMSALVAPSIDQVKQNLLAAKVVCTDAFHLTVNGDLAYVRNFSDLRNELLYAMAGKSLEDLRQIDLLVAYAGILVHDHEVALYHFGGAISIRIVIS